MRRPCPRTACGRTVPHIVSTGDTFAVGRDWPHGSPRAFHGKRVALIETIKSLDKLIVLVCDFINYVSVVVI